MHMKPKQFDGALIEEGVSLILKGLGEDLNREGLLDTPRRVAKMYREIFCDSSFNGTQFCNSEQYNQIVMVRDIPFYSLCEHHMLPFFGTATVGYIPQKTYLGLSKLARVVDLYSRQLQVQERMTMQIADWLWEQTNPAGVGVMVKARHLCMEMRGIQKIGSETVTTATLGVFRTDKEIEDRFMRFIGV